LAWSRSMTRSPDFPVEIPMLWAVCCHHALICLRSRVAASSQLVFFSTAGVLPPR
jgi:hypothetical protein